MRRAKGISFRGLGGDRVWGRLRAGVMVALCSRKVALLNHLEHLVVVTSNCGIQSVRTLVHNAYFDTDCEPINDRFFLR